MVCCAYDDLFLEHDLPTHPERADRLRAVHAYLAENGILDRMRSLPAPAAPDEWLVRIHDPAYLTWLQEHAVAPTRYVERDTYMGPASYQAAVHAVGAAVACTRAVLDGSADRGLALVRPPGHHARRDGPMGFCLLNNAACAAADALAAGLERVLILDFDGHHGNGTQDAFWTDPRVLYVSIHQSPLFPGTGSPLERGSGPGEGYTINLPLPTRSGDRSYAYLTDEVIVPTADGFRPDLVLLSAGYDSHWRDPLTSLSASLDGLTAIAARSVEVAERHCHGRVVAVLEGGYDLEALSIGVGNLSEVLLGTPERCVDPLGPAPATASDDLSYLARLRELVLGAQSLGRQHVV